MKKTPAFIEKIILSIVVLVAAGCASTQERLLDSGVSQVQLRSIQSRAFDTTDKENTLRTVMATLQDLGFVIDEGDAVLGTISATKLNRYELRMTVSVRPRGESQMLVRANCQYQNKPVHDPGPYQQFFTSLEKAMFLEAQQVEWLLFTIYPIQKGLLSFAPPRHSSHRDRS